MSTELMQSVLKEPVTNGYGQMLIHWVQSINRSIKEFVQRRFVDTISLRKKLVSTKLNVL